MTISDNDSLLSFVVLRHTMGPEDAATDALSFILKRSPSAMRALSECLGDDDGPLPVARVGTQAFLESSRAYPDMALHDSEDNLSAYVESKFWAPLTHNQPVTYWEALPTDRRSVLMFLAPKYRVDEPSLWEELVSRLREKGHKLGPTDRNAMGISAKSAIDQRRLMLASWTVLLGKLEGSAKKDGDAQAEFEVVQLQALAANVVGGTSDPEKEEFKQILADAVARLRESGWADTKGLTVGQGYGYYGRYLRLAGAYAWLGIVDEAAKQMPDKPLWLSFGPWDPDYVGLDLVRDRLEDELESRTEWHGLLNVCVPLSLPTDAGANAMRHAIVTELERIARLIDPDGPTYR